MRGYNETLKSGYTTLEDACVIASLYSRTEGDDGFPVVATMLML